MSEQRTTPETETDEQTAAGTASNGRGDTSMFAGLRAKREKIGGDRHIDLDVPGYDGALVIRYGVVSWDEGRKMAEKFEQSKNPDKDLWAQVDFLIKGCQMVLMKDDDGNLQPLHKLTDAFGDEPVRFDDRLASALGIDATSARQVVLGTFNNEWAMTAQHNQFGEWLASSRVEDDESF